MEKYYRTWHKGRNKYIEIAIIPIMALMRTMVMMTMVMMMMMMMATWMIMRKGQEKDTMMEMFTLFKPDLQDLIARLLII